MYTVDVDVHDDEVAGVQHEVGTTDTVVDVDDLIHVGSRRPQLYVVNHVHRDVRRMTITICHDSRSMWPRSIYVHVDDERHVTFVFDMHVRVDVVRFEPVARIVQHTW